MIGLRLACGLGLVAALGFVAGCAEDNPAPHSEDAGNGGNDGAAMDGAPSDGAANDGAPSDGSGGDGSLLGCVGNPSLCTGGDMCCAGNPYPITGECHPSCVAVSDRNVKHDVKPVDPDRVLSRLESLPVSSWRYDAQPEEEHVGPMAQDFHATFGLGGSDRRIDLVDANGVVMAAVQGLAGRVEKLQARVDTLEKENAALRRELGAR